ncbi:MAG: FG-GAP-like repeat-containing protein [Bacteroidia bacterium]|nr:FG-GAP-like repeat-containing protein [Bacteroidia bacterium]
MKPIYLAAISFFVINQIGFSAWAQLVNLFGTDSVVQIPQTIFLPKNTLSSGKENWGVALIDIDNDSDLDIVSSSQLDNNINVHLNDGKGNFSPKKSYVTGLNPRSIATGDFNKDGKIDIATVSIKDGNLNWHIQQPDGGFYIKKNTYTGVFPHWVEAADINNDGKTDLITVTNADNNINIHLNDGTGNFGKPINIKTATNPRVVKFADINNDGKLDLIVGSDGDNISIHLSLAASPQIYQPKISIPSGKAIWGLGIADLNRDGKPDIVAASYFDAKICIHLNNGHNRFEPARMETSGEFNFDLVLGDFDADGDIDVVTASTRDGCLNIHLNDGKGNLSPKSCLKSGDWNSRVVAGDIDGDKDLDVISASIKDDNINIHKNTSLDPEKPIEFILLEGSIMDKKTNTPLSGKITIETANNTLITENDIDTTGGFKFVIPNDSLRIKVWVPGYPRYVESFFSSNPTDKEGVLKNIYLEKISETTICGRVMEGKTHQPIPNAVLYLQNFKKQLIDSFFTDENGEYQIQLLLANNYRLTAVADSYNGKTAQFSVTITHISIGLEPDFELIKTESKTIVCLEGFIKDEITGNPLGAATVKVHDLNGNILKETTGDTKGYYKLCLPFGHYLIAITRKDYFFKTDSLILNQNQVYQIIQYDVPMKKIETNKGIVVKSFFFDIDKASLRVESVSEFERLLSMLQENPTIKIEIANHTDSDGADEFNMRLSQARAQTIVDWLLDAKISPERLSAKGYGETRPIAPNDTPENKQKNCRTEIQVISN